LRDTFGESCSLGILDGDDVLYVGRAAHDRIMTVGLHVGSRLPLLTTSMGRVLVAAMPADEIKALLARTEAVARTPVTITDPARLRLEFDRVATHGYSLVDEELETGLRSIAVPVTNRSGTVIAALNLGASAARMSTEILEGAVLPRLRRAAAELSHLVA
jgi:IclR family pca regulon transcriptional regulator